MLDGGDLWSLAGGAVPEDPSKANGFLCTFSVKTSVSPLALDSNCDHPVVVVLLDFSVFVVLCTLAAL